MCGKGGAKHFRKLCVEPWFKRTWLRRQKELLRIPQIMKSAKYMQQLFQTISFACPPSLEALPGHKLTHLCLTKNNGLNFELRCNLWDSSFGFRPQKKIHLPKLYQETIKIQKTNVHCFLKPRIKSHQQTNYIQCVFFSPYTLFFLTV